MTKKLKIVVAITGASGSIYAKILIEKLTQLDGFIDLASLSVIASPTGEQVYKYETGDSIRNVKGINYYENSDFNAAFASGSAGYDAMIIIPCSMGTMGRIAQGVSDNLITRAADVMLKERKTLILVCREMPYNLIHIKNMELVTLAGGIVCPASPSFYSNPYSVEDLCNTVTYRVLQLIGVETNSFKWGTKI